MFAWNLWSMLDCWCVVIIFWENRDRAIGVSVFACYEALSSIIYRDLELDSIRPLKVHHNYIKVDLHTYSLHKIKVNHKLVFFFFFLSVPFPVCYLCAEITRTLVQKLKTRVVKKNCNPVWNEELTLSISDLNVPINLVSNSPPYASLFMTCYAVNHSAIDLFGAIITYR